MKYPVLLILFLLSDVCRADEPYTLLSPEKQEMLRLEREAYEAEHEKLRTNWIAPLNLSGTYDYDRSAQGEFFSTTETVSGSITQDIFRSGGITYQIAYADAKKERESLSRQKEIALLNRQLFISILEYRKALFEKEQTALKLKNKEIEVAIKRHLFDAGKADITELNNALMEKSAELKSLAAIEYSIAEQRYEIAKISDVAADSFELPRFELIDRKAYLDEELDLRYTRANTQTQRYAYEVTASDYLPSIALNAALGYRRYDPKERTGDYDGHYYNTGISLTLPLSYNASSTVQEARALYLKEAASVADKRRSLEGSYAQAVEKIKSFEETIALIRRNLSLYDDLIGAIRSGVEAGTKTGYDLQTLQNSRSIEEFDIRIYEIDIQIELAKLHFALNPSKELP
ncbi:MAG: TolC family protein [Sulfuricurvum sp.]|nr:TolC family protein [Sulfuricurvum sp.]